MSSRVAVSSSSPEPVSSSKLQRRVTLAYKNENLLANFKREDDKVAEDEDVELDPVETAIRTVLLPVALPLILIYLCFAKKERSRIRTEIHSMRVAEYKAAHPESAEDDSNSHSMDVPEYESDEEDDRTFVERFTEARKRSLVSLRACARSIHEFIFHDEKKKKAEGPFSTRLSNVSRRVPTTAKFVPAIDVARTDRAIYPYDGIFVGNFFVDVKDTEKLKSLLQKQLENDNDKESQSSLDEILQNVATSRGVANFKVPLERDFSPSVDASPERRALLEDSPSPTNSNLRKQKPKKQAPADGIVRVNPEVAARISLDGPSVLNLDQALGAGIGGSDPSPLRSRIRQQRRGWDPDSVYDEAFANAEATLGGPASPLSGLASYVPDNPQAPHLVDYLIMNFHGKSQASPQQQQQRASPSRQSSSGAF